MEAREIGDELMATVCLRFSAKSDAARDGSPIVQSGPRWASVSRFSRWRSREIISRGNARQELTSSWLLYLPNLATRGEEGKERGKAEIADFMLRSKFELLTDGVFSPRTRKVPPGRSLSKPIGTRPIGRLCEEVGASGGRIFFASGVAWTHAGRRFLASSREQESRTLWLESHQPASFSHDRMTRQWRAFFLC